MSTQRNRAMTRSPLTLARTALQVATAALPPYSAQFSKKDFPQPQLVAILVLQQFLKTAYRGLVQLVAQWSDLRQELPLKTVPQYSTLCHAHPQLLQKGLLPAS